MRISRVSMERVGHRFSESLTLFEKRNRGAQQGGDLRADKYDGSDKKLTRRARSLKRGIDLSPRTLRILAWHLRLSNSKD